MKVAPLLLLLLLAASLPSDCGGLSSPDPRSSAATAAAAPPATIGIDPPFEFDYRSEDALPWVEGGYSTWRWKGKHDVNYIELGDDSKPALVLIHGFGASSFHFRSNLPVLARDFHVFAFCKLGFGLSDKPLVDYSSELWRDQAVDFLTEVVRKPAVLAGNSLGGFTSLYAAATEEVKPMVRGVVLLNSAGRFRDPNADEETDPTPPEEPNGFLARLQDALQRAVISASFVLTKQPLRIEQILKQVYPIATDRVDPALVESIRLPSLDPNAMEVFYRVIKKTGGGPVTVYNDDLLERTDCPILLCWGESDPWIVSATADRIQRLKPSCERVSIDAGHCPHDEQPEAVNDAIRDFMLSLPA
eukprot:CAMPEP_0197174068 /NCGR_PEP_ID=MMETSP1423-20130617/753_1 /TAXON_ID=476441 /ORGANISM="Pseudo-nitzschia heimii, Strain UNC1101" /LENGTH=359 /DNA_ID=CAMNT_0042622963 /DNA_START=68 /DNA_END=1147 /DNA_ORIENTATION=+